MADIPVERVEKSAFPMWLIPLLLLLLLLPLLYFTCGRSNVAVVDNTNANRRIVTANANGSLANAGNSIGNGVNAVANTVGNGVNAASNTVVVTNTNAGGANADANAANGGTVTAVNYFGTIKDKNTIVGRNVDLSSVRVNRVLSDKVFTVKSENEEMFVMLDDALDSPGGKESQIKIRPGQNLKLAGNFRTVPTGEVKDERKGGGLSGKEYAQMKGQQVYLHATGVEDVK